MPRGTWGNDTPVNPPVFLSVVYVRSYNLRSLFTDRPTMVFYPIYNSLSFLNLFDESFSDFCLPHEKGTFISHLRAVSQEKKQFDGFRILATDWSAFRELREFVPHVSSYHMKTILVYRKPSHFCNEMWDVETKRMPCMSKQMTKAMGMNHFIKLPESFCRK